MKDENKKYPHIILLHNGSFALYEEKGKKIVFDNPRYLKDYLDTNKVNIEVELCVTIGNQVSIY